ncbi:MAG: DNA primase [Parasphingorhabdus sp.]|nr:DNA primase [Parasphingorhabdus sp.]
MSLSPQWLDQLRGRITLSSLIGRSMKLQKAGREYKGCCPFHNEKTPSFTVNDEKGFYHCFGCSAHGDAIRWMTDQRGLGFMDAVKELAAEAGLDVPAPDPRAAAQAEARNGLHDVMAAAQDWFVAQLNGMAGADARDYLARRGIKQKTIETFGFGFAPDSRDALKSALAQFDIELLVEAGMLIKVDDKQPYDRFRGRLMIPIRDARGRVIAFGGRILGDGDAATGSAQAAKYLNSPDTPLFDKGRTLYNLDRASPASRQTGRIIVVEGYMDAIALSQAGFEDVVAPLGTALTEHQIERLWKMVETPTLCFDGDAAGQKAAMRAATRALPLLRPGHSLQFATLPPGQDPDDVLRANGPAAMVALLGAAHSLIDHVWQFELAAAPLETPEEKAGCKKRLLDHVAAIGDAEVARHYGEALRNRYDAQFFPPREYRARGYGSGGLRGNRATAKRDFRVAQKPVVIASHDLRIARAILGGLLRHPSQISANFELLLLLDLGEAESQAMLGAMIDAAKGDATLDKDRLFTILEALGMYNMAKGLLRADALNFTFNREHPADAPEAARERAYRDLGEAIKVVAMRPQIDNALAAATRSMAERLDEASFAEQQRLRQAKAEFAGRLLELTTPDEGI